jgi:predicted ester cyclase
VTGLDGRATGAYAAGLVESFPDLRFELVSVALTAEDSVAAQWVMRGTNTGPFAGLPPTGRQIALAGADFIRCSSDGIVAVEGYFDGGALPRQLGLNVIVQPESVGPFSFGNAVRATRGNDAVPGALSVTVLEVRSDAEVEEVRARTRQIVGELLDAPGFISWFGATVGHRMLTLTAWESVDAVRELRINATHQDSVRVTYGPEIGAGGVFGVLVPTAVKTSVRCESCGTRTPPAEHCACGAALPAPPLWV